MGLSAKDSRVFYIPHACPIKLNGTPPNGNRLRLSEQVTRIEITPSVSQRKYAHDKSFGTQDVCSGIKSWDGSISTKVANPDYALTLTASDTVWIKVYPVGTGCGHPLQGYGVIDSDPITMNLENGEPVEHNYRFSSKGKWTGFPHGGQKWGGYECGCSGQGSGAMVPAARMSGFDEPLPAESLVHAPVTAYQWNGTAWLSVYDESTEGFVPGTPPTEPGAFVGQLSFVPCEVG